MPQEDMQKLNDQIAQKFENLKKIDEVSAQEAKAQQQTPATINTPQWWTTTNAMTMSAVVLVFAFLIAVLAAYLMQKGKEGEVVLRVLGTIMIVFLAVFLVVAGYDDKQISPVMGLLGTIAGYLLGKQSTSPQTRKEEKSS
jgi:ABC-type polysaccharide transport system permease subunit